MKEVKKNRGFIEYCPKAGDENKKQPDGEFYKKACACARLARVYSCEIPNSFEKTLVIERDMGSIFDFYPTILEKSLKKLEKTKFDKAKEKFKNDLSRNISCSYCVAVHVNSLLLSKLHYELKKGYIK